MKLHLLILTILYSCNLSAQGLPANPQTGLVSIQDSIELKNKTIQEVKDALSKWGNTLMDLDNLKTIFKLNNSKQVENIGINLPVGSVLTVEKGNNKFLINGSMGYGKAKEVRLFNAVSTNPANGVVKFSLSYTITAQKIIYEFTNLEFSNTGVYYGKFEDERPPKDNKGIMSLNKKMWQDVKAEHFDRIRTLSVNLKEYLSNLLPNNSNVSPVNYESYKKIKIGMTYDEVIKIFGDEGKELSNSSSQVNGKIVILQTVIWYDLDKAKTISVSLSDGKVTGKSQSNL